MPAMKTQMPSLKSRRCGEYESGRDTKAKTPLAANHERREVCELESGA
jgi:hypothetical protein